MNVLLSIGPFSVILLYEDEKPKFSLLKHQFEGVASYYSPRRLRINRVGILPDGINIDVGLNEVIEGPVKINLGDGFGLEPRWILCPRTKTYFLRYIYSEPPEYKDGPFVYCDGEVFYENVPLVSYCAAAAGLIINEHVIVLCLKKFDYYFLYRATGFKGYEIIKHVCRPEYVDYKEYDFLDVLVLDKTNIMEKPFHDRLAKRIPP